MSDNVSEINAELHTSLAFSAQQIRWCKKLVKNRDEFETTSRLLYDSWAAKGWVAEFDEGSYQALWSNELLKKATLLHLAEQLSTEIEDVSKTRLEQTYGCGIISPFDVYFNCQTDKGLNAFIKQRNLLIDIEQYRQIQLCRNRLVTRMTNLRRDLFEAIGLPGTPSRSYAPVITKESKKVVDKEAVQEQINELNQSMSTAAFAAASASAEVAVDMDEQDIDGNGDGVGDGGDDGDGDGDDGLQSLSGSTGEVVTGGKRKDRSLNRDLLAGSLAVKDFLIAKYPAIQTSGIILVITDHGELEVVDLDCATCTACKKQLVL